MINKEKTITQTTTTQKMKDEIRKTRMEVRLQKRQLIKNYKSSQLEILQVERSNMTRKDLLQQKRQQRLETRTRNNQK